MATLRDKVKMYEGLLHDIQMHREVTMDNDKVINLLDNICDWSYAHRVGNGEYTDNEQKEIVASRFAKLRTIRKGDK
jgi:hypothetical protein